MTNQETMSTQIICELPLRGLEENNILDITQYGTPCRYRLIDCAAFVHAAQLVILEFTSFPTIPYAVVSYVWRGNGPDPQFSGPEFAVKGAEDGDPIGFEVLREVCVASIALGTTHIWLDRLCIMQTVNEDKKWQIREMYKMYRFCQVCVVAPGGIQRLVRLDEETQWIHRGWTLQEAVAPPKVVVLFSWRLGSRMARAGDTAGPIDEVSPLKSAMAPLSLIVDASTTGSLSIDHDEKSLLVEVTLFSSHPADRSYRDFPFWRPTRRILSPNVGALARAMSDELDQDMKDYSIWQSALMRTSSRPVDMVFSIMGLFDVTLDTSQFGANDRVPATIALARAILEKGGRVSWLAAAFRIPPSPHISTFPVFPRTSVSGKAYVAISGGLQEVSLLMENEYPIAAALVSMPYATMDRHGYLSFTAKCIRLDVSLVDVAEPAAAKPEYVKAVDGTRWKIREDGDMAEGDVFAVLVGFFVGYYPGGTPAHDANNIRAMVVQKHATDRFHVRSYLMLSRRAMQWVKAWPERTFSIGGPGVDAVEEDGEDLPIISVAREQYINNPQSGLSKVTLEDQVVRRSRWAVPQKTLERTYTPY
ncbi:hypothetical protein B0H19DRAFT_1056849 [Mycena capillaripes]|nr:hypothetical protein B0H19DRAFT_1056849 [Mycena capillaripes]